MEKRNKIEEEAIVKMLAKRDEKSIGILFDNYSASLYGVIHKIIQDDAIAEEVLKETFLKIWEDHLQYNFDKGRLFTWMINICRKLAIEKLRSKGHANRIKSKAYDEIGSVNTSFFSPSYNPDTVGVREIVNKMEPEYKFIVDLLFFEGYSQSEAAEKLNIPLGTVKTRSRAALNKLKSFFANA